MVCLFASIVSVRLRTYHTDVNVPASIAATTGTITMFFFTHSNLDNLVLGCFFAINYLLNLDTIQSDTHAQPALILSQTLQQMFLHFSIMFFLLNFIEEPVRIFCTPRSTIFYIPFRCLHFPIWDIVLYCERRYVPYTSIVWLCCIVPIV